MEQLALDLPKFMESSGKEKAQTLLKIIGVGDQLTALEQQEKELYNERLYVGRTADQKVKFAKEQPYYPDAPKDLVSPSDLIKQQQEILARKVCNELGCAVIYCHHHSKGSQGGKRSMDRASGSGVFARDPDAMLDLIELDVTDDLRKQEQNKTVCATCQTYLDSHFGWEDDLSQDDLCSQVQMMNYCREHLSPMQMRELQKQIDTNLITTNTKTAWRIDGTLREFPKFKPVNLWFDYPIHHTDQSGALDDVQPEDEKPNWKKGQEARKKQGEVQRKNKQAKVDMAIESFRFEHHDTYPTVKELYEQIKSNSEAVGEKYPAEKTLWNSLKKYGYTTDKETKRIIPLP